MSDMSAVNIEQEWNDFDEIMTEDSLGIRLQAQLLMERKLMLKQQQKQIRNKIKKQKEEEDKLQQRIVRHRQNSKNINNNNSISQSNKTMIVNQNSNNSLIDPMNIPDIPDENTVSTIDELYGSFHDDNKARSSKTGNNDTSDDDVYDAEKNKNLYKFDKYFNRSMSRESEILHELKTLTNDIDQELQLVEDRIIDTQSMQHYNSKVKSYSSLTSYNNKMIDMMRNGHKNNKNSSLTNILPFHRSQTQNQQLLKIIHTIENMPKPYIKNNIIIKDEDNNGLVNVIIREFTQMFNELLIEMKYKHLGIVQDNNNNKRRDSVDLDIYASQDTIPIPNNLDNNINNTPPNVGVNNIPKLLRSDSLLYKKKKNNAIIDS
eukprot:260319_1